MIDNDSYYRGYVYICLCNAITERQVRECASAGAQSIDDLSSSLGIGTGCGRCVECAVELLREACAGQPKTAVAVPK